MAASARCIGHAKPPVHSCQSPEELVVKYLEYKLEQFLTPGTPKPSGDWAKFLWERVRNIHRLLDPYHTGRGRVWREAQSMLKELINWEFFDPAACNPRFLRQLVDPDQQVPRVLQRYIYFLRTGEVITLHPHPRVLGQTEKVLFISKPANFTCSYGGEDEEPPDVSNAVGPTSLLNRASGKIQIHEYIARRFDFETARCTREYWRTGETSLRCTCQCCDFCAAVVAGCVNRLDIETSGVMVVAKTCDAFQEMRVSISDKSPGSACSTQKHYLALVHGDMDVPEEVADPERPGWGVVEGFMRWDPKLRKAMVWTEADEAAQSSELEKRGRDTGGKLCAKTIYRPLVKFTSTAGSSAEVYTLVQLQIFQGRRHQIRYHCALRGHPLVGDARYWDTKYKGNVEYERLWSPRVFLHSYRTVIAEPGTGHRLEAVAPMHLDLCTIVLRLMRGDASERPTATAGVAQAGSVPFRARVLCRDCPKILTEGCDELTARCQFFESGSYFSVNGQATPLSASEKQPPLPALGPAAPATPMEHQPVEANGARQQAAPLSAAEKQPPLPALGPAAPAAPMEHRPVEANGARQQAAPLFAAEKQPPLPALGPAAPAAPMVHRYVEANGAKQPCLAEGPGEESGAKRPRLAEGSDTGTAMALPLVATPEPPPCTPGAAKAAGALSPQALGTSGAGSAASSAQAAEGLCSAAALRASRRRRPLEITRTPLGVLKPAKVMITAKQKEHPTRGRRLRKKTRPEWPGIPRPAWKPGVPPQTKHTGIKERAAPLIERRPAEDDIDREIRLPLKRKQRKHICMRKQPVPVIEIKDEPELEVPYASRHDASWDLMQLMQSFFKLTARVLDASGLAQHRSDATVGRFVPPAQLQPQAPPLQLQLTVEGIDFNDL